VVAATRAGEPGRRGASRLGCVVLLVLLAVAVYVGLNVGGIYFRYYRFEDEMKQSARFAAQLSDSAIAARISVAADSLGLPRAAKNVSIVRVGKSIAISGSYSELVDLKVWKHFLHFTPSARATY
jgi:hypothetical protein